MRWAAEVFDAIEDLLGGAIGPVRRREAFYLSSARRWVVALDTEAARYIAGVDVRAAHDSRQNHADHACLGDALLGLLQRLAAHPGVKWADIERLSKLVRRLARKEMTP